MLYLLLVKRVRRKTDEVIGVLSGEIFSENTQTLAKKLIGICEYVKKQLDILNGLLDSNNPGDKEIIPLQWDQVKAAFQKWGDELKATNIQLSEFQQNVLKILYEKIQVAILDEKPTLEDMRAEFNLMLFTCTLTEIQDHLRTHPIAAPSSFISYAWGKKADENFVHEQLARPLKDAGVGIILDIWHNETGDILKFIKRIDTADTVLVIGTPLLKQKFDEEQPFGSYVHEELEKSLLRIKEKPDKHGVLKVLINGKWFESFPDDFKKLPHDSADFTLSFNYYEKFFNLLKNIHKEALKFKVIPMSSEISEYLKYLDTKYEELKVLIDKMNNQLQRITKNETELERLLKLSPQELKQYLHEHSPKQEPTAASAVVTIEAQETSSLSVHSTMPNIASLTPALQRTGSPLHAVGGPATKSHFFDSAAATTPSQSQDSTPNSIVTNAKAGDSIFSGAEGRSEVTDSVAKNDIVSVGEKGALVQNATAGGNIVSNAGKNFTWPQPPGMY